MKITVSKYNKIYMYNKVMSCVCQGYNSVPFAILLKLWYPNCTIDLLLDKKYEKVI